MMYFLLPRDEAFQAMIGPTPEIGSSLSGAIMIDIGLNRLHKV